LVVVVVLLACRNPESLKPRNDQISPVPLRYTTKTVCQSSNQRPLGNARDNTNILDITDHVSLRILYYSYPFHHTSA
jgi:hypothetical protein